MRMYACALMLPEDRRGAIKTSFDHSYAYLAIFLKCNLI